MREKEKSTKELCLLNLNVLLCWDLGIFKEKRRINYLYCGFYDLKSLSLKLRTKRSLSDTLQISVSSFSVNWLEVTIKYSSKSLISLLFTKSM